MKLPNKNDSKYYEGHIFLDKKFINDCEKFCEELIDLLNEIAKDKYTNFGWKRKINNFIKTNEK